jgi:hypothetical protein
MSSPARAILRGAEALSRSAGELHAISYRIGLLGDQAAGKDLRRGQVLLEQFEALADDIRGVLETPHLRRAP